MTQSRGWDGILSPGEEILWQGQPDTSIRWRDAFSPQGAFGLVFTGFALFWMVAASAMISTGEAPFPFSMFPLFGFPFLAVGLYMVVGHVIVDAYLRSHTWYTLTDQTAFIATQILGQKTLSSYPIFRMPFLDYEEGAPGSVLFAYPRRQRNDDVPLNAIGFRHIPEARAVYTMLREARGALNFAARDDRDET